MTVKIEVFQKVSAVLVIFKTSEIRQKEIKWCFCNCIVVYNQSAAAWNHTKKNEAIIKENYEYEYLRNWRTITKSLCK